MNPTKSTPIGVVYLDADAEQRFLARALRAGGRVVTTAETTAAAEVAEALELVARTVAVLELIVVPDDLPPVIRDVVPRA